MLGNPSIRLGCFRFHFVSAPITAAQYCGQNAFSGTERFNEILCVLLGI